MHVACIDDDQIFGKLVSRKLQRRDVQCSHFESASAFLRADKPTRYDMVLVDLEMPDPDGISWEMGGVVLIRELRKRYGDASRICVLTGHEYPALMDMTVENGADAHLTKHADLDRLCDEIVEVIGVMDEDRELD